MRTSLLLFLLIALLMISTNGRAWNEASEYVLEFRITQQGKKTHVEVWIQPDMGRTGVIYFEIAEGTLPLEHLQLYPIQAHIQESGPTPFISTPYSYYARYKKENHQRVDRTMLKVSNLVFPIRLLENIPDGVHNLVLAVSIDQDQDGAFAQARVLKDSRWLQFCLDYDQNHLVHPLQTKFFYEPREDGSWDWNCNGKINLSQITYGKPGMYERLGSRCVEVIPTAQGWVNTIPTEVGAVAHCYPSFTGNNAAARATKPNEVGSVCESPTALCVQGGN